MFAGYLIVVVVALFGSEFGRIVEAGDSALCTYLKDGAVTMIRRSTPYSNACTVSRLDNCNLFQWLP